MKTKYSEKGNSGTCGPGKYIISNYIHFTI